MTAPLPELPSPWTGDPVVYWLLTEGWDLADPGALVGAVGERLNADGLPVRRLVFGISNLHPSIIGHMYVWEREAGVRRVQGERAILSQPGYLRSPVYLLDQGATEVRRRLDLGDPLEFPLYEELRAAGHTDYLALSLRLGWGDDNLISATTDRPGGFSEAQLDRLRRLRSWIGRVLAPHAWHQVAVNLLDI